MPIGILSTPPGGAAYEVLERLDLKTADAANEMDPMAQSRPLSLCADPNRHAQFENLRRVMVTIRSRSDPRTKIHREEKQVRIHGSYDERASVVECGAAAPLSTPRSNFARRGRGNGIRFLKRLFWISIRSRWSRARPKESGAAAPHSTTLTR